MSGAFFKPQGVIGGQDNLCFFDAGGDFLNGGFFNFRCKVGKI